MLVTAGAFWMGPDDGPADEAPRHRVDVADFRIERVKVSAAEFAEFLNAEGTVSPEGERRYDEDDRHARIHLVRLGMPPQGEWEKAAGGSHGVEDLLGDFREWTSTMLKPYPYRHDDRREPFTGGGRVVVRGERPATSRRSYDGGGAAIGNHNVGFRCATSEDLGGY